MDKLSQLIKEAKPLYKQRKLRRNITKCTLALCLPVFMFISIYEVCLEGENVYVALSQDSYNSIFLDDEYGIFY